MFRLHTVTKMASAQRSDFRRRVTGSLDFTHALRQRAHQPHFCAAEVIWKKHPQRRVELEQSRKEQIGNEVGDRCDLGKRLLDEHDVKSGHERAHKLC